MSKSVKQFEDLIQRLNHLSLSLSVDQNNVNQNQLNNDLKQMTESCESNVNEINICLNRLKTINNQFNQQMSQLSPLLVTISPLLDKYEGLVKLDKLLERLKTIKEINNNLDTNANHLKNNKDFEGRVVSITHSFNQLVNEYNVFNEKHKNDLMKAYLKQIIVFWSQMLSKRFEEKFNQTFESIGWPSVGDHKTQPNIESMNTFVMYFNALLSVDIERQLMSNTDKSSDDRSQRSESPIVLPIGLMLRPLKKRFSYHFMETKSKLNRSEKPEWYLSQTIQWIKQNEDFLTQNIDPILRTHSSIEVIIPSKLQFICGLLQCVSIKLKSDLPSLVFDDKIFTHIVDEVLVFSRELLDIEPNIFDVFPDCNLTDIFSSEPFFSRIVSLEKKKSTEFVEFILKSKTAWNEICGPEGNDELRICECADNFVVMLQSVTNRCSLFTDNSLKYQFFRLQIEILDDFRLRLIQLLNNTDQSWPYSQQYFSIINTFNYLTQVLDEWKNLPFFVQMSEIYSPNETLFDEIIGLFEHVLNELVFQIKHSFINQLKDNFQNYQTIKWFCMKSMDDCLTSSASELLHFLSSNLVSLQKSLSNTLFETILHEIAEQINRILVEDLVLKNSFNDFGSKQLHFDVSVGFVSVFRLFMSRPQLHFAPILDALKLLTLEKGTSLLLTDTLLEDRNSEAKVALKEMGILSISPPLAQNILKKRLFFK